MSLSFKKRIASHFILATAIIIAVVFSIVYFIVQKTVYNNLDADLSYEANKHTYEIDFSNGSVKFNNKDEWEESEHKEIQVNPVFIALADTEGNITDKSPNLKERFLPFQNDIGSHFNSKLNNRLIRQVQIPIERKGKIKGYIIAGMSLDSSIMVLKNLRNTLLFLYPIVLIGLFFISAFLAGRSIFPVTQMTVTANRITKNNLNERIDPPQKKDELFDLSSAINSLLDRLEGALEREKQFTSDASHELRTPLSVLRGTFEVALRKERTVEEYQEKIAYSLTEIDRMVDITEQLLTLARIDSDTHAKTNLTMSIDDILNQAITLRSKELNNNNVHLTIDKNTKASILVNGFHANLILDNLISNAIKYSQKSGEINISVLYDDNANSVRVTIKDHGIGINEVDMSKIFNPFFRSDSLNHKEAKGIGLGLAIAQKAATQINAQLTIKSVLGKGTSVDVIFNEILSKS
jgi:signal transduction histidine kinase